MILRNGYLMVNHVERVHQKIEDMLATLRIELVAQPVPLLADEAGKTQAENDKEPIPTRQRPLVALETRLVALTPDCEKPAGLIALVGVNK